MSSTVFICGQTLQLTHKLFRKSCSSSSLRGHIRYSSHYHHSRLKLLGENYRCLLLQVNGCQPKSPRQFHSLCTFNFFELTDPSSRRWVHASLSRYCEKKDQKSQDETTQAVSQNISDQGENKDGKDAQSEPLKSKADKVKDTVVKVLLKKKPKLDVTQSTTERNFITPVRAMNEYLLKPSDLMDLRRFQRRSPYANEPPIAVYLRRDVEARALQTWGTWDALQKELAKRKEEEAKYIASVFEVKRLLREFKRQNDPESKMREELLKGSKTVVQWAVAINFGNFCFKTLAWLYTGSHSLFAEAVHSLADTLNQCILAFGIRKSIQKPNRYHPYGYHQMRYVTSLISGVGIFCVGCGLSLYHGINGILHPEQMESLFWAFCILGGSLISEGGTLNIAYNAVKKGAKRQGLTIRQYVFRSQDPSVSVVFLEDMAAVVGVLIAGSCMGLTAYFDSPIYDAIGSLLIGGLLGAVAMITIKSNSGALVGRSIPQDQLQEINKILESDVMVRQIHDVKATDMGNDIVRYKAEVDFDGRQLTRHYLDAIDLEALLKEMQELQSIEDVESFMLKHGENIVDLLGAEIDRIERELKKRHPELRHVDLEVL